MIQDGRVLLIRRGKEPLKGRWVVPGGTLELGETLEEALVREMAEETGLRVAVGEALTVFDRVESNEGVVRYHYVIVDYLCTYVSGEAVAASDAEALAWAAPEDLAAYDMPAKALEVVLDAFARLSRAGGACSPPTAGLPCTGLK